MIEVTSRQNEYLKELATGPKLNNELILAMMVSQKGVSHMMRVLKGKGLVQSAHAPSTGRGSTQVHSLTKSYDAILADGLEIVRTTHRNDSKPIKSEEIAYIAELRRSGLVGQRLVAAHQRLFPERNANGVRHVVKKAVKEGLCR